MYKLLLLACCVALTAASTGSLIRSKATFDVLDSHGTLTSADFLANDTLYAATHVNIASGFNAAFLSGEHVIDCYENGPALVSIYTSCIIYSTSGDRLTELGRLYADYDVGVSNGVPSPVTSRPYVVRGFYTITPDSVSPYRTKFELVVNGYNFFTGFETQPRLRVNLATVNPGLFTLTPAYSGPSGIADDGRFLFYTLGVGTSFVPYFGLLLPVPQSQVYGILDFAVDGRAYTKRVEIPANPAGLPFYLSFTQGAQIVARGDGHTYDILVAANTYAGLIDPLGKNAHLVTYVFDAATDTLTLMSVLPVNQYIQGFHMSADGLLAAVVTNEVLSKVAKNPLLPYPNQAGNQTDNLRLYGIAPVTRALTLLDTRSLFADGIQIRFGPKKTVFVTTSPRIYDDLIPSPFTPDPARLRGAKYRHYGCNTIRSYIIDQNNRFVPQDDAGLAPLTFGLAINGDESRVFASGMPISTQNDNVLLSVVDNSKQ